MSFFFQEFCRNHPADPLYFTCDFFQHHFISVMKTQVKDGHSDVVQKITGTISSMGKRTDSAPVYIGISDIFVNVTYVTFVDLKQKLYWVPNTNPKQNIMQMKFQEVPTILFDRDRPFTTIPTPINFKFSPIKF